MINGTKKKKNQYNKRNQIIGIIIFKIILRDQERDKDKALFNWVGTSLRWWYPLPHFYINLEKV